MKASGLNNIGLLIKTWGMITHIADGYMYIDDGSNLNDDPNNSENTIKGVRVICNTSQYKLGDYVTVVGISSCFKRDEYILRQILTRSNDDIQIIKEGENES